MTNLILCGGSGTRLWPLSRKMFPKQFCDITGDRSLFQDTFDRNRSFCSSFYVVTSADHYFMSVDQIGELSADDTLLKTVHFFLEPVGRNTAPAIALACLDLDPEEVVFVTPSDHIILKLDQYVSCAREAEKLACAGHLVTFGIKPAYAETGYGYIESEKSASGCASKAVHFHEKPDAARAEKYIAQGNFFWNSGMFVFKAGVFLAELKNHSPEIYDACAAVYQKRVTRDDDDLCPAATVSADDMKTIPSNSIDYAVMEKSANVMVVPADIGWNDLGSFDSLYDILPKDADGNTRSDHLINIDSKQNLIVSSKRTIALVDVESSIIVDTDDALLITKRGSSQKVKQAVEVLQKQGEKELELTELHRTVHRPWGTYTVLEDNGNYKIKSIMVKSGKRISLQKHMHRSEHWVVVEGTAQVTLEREIRLVRKNESTYIPIGAAHRLENPGKIDLVIIETQVGDYVGEDDIIRLSDDFGREEK